MRTLSKALLPATVIGIALSIYACGAGVSTGVYVGVAVPGPYIGYPGVGYPGYIGRPPYVYEEDALNLPGGAWDNVAFSADPEVRPDRGCRSDDRGSATCFAGEREQLTTGSLNEVPSRPERAEPDNR